MKFQMLLNNDYDKKIKIKKQKVFCYSNKQLKRLYPNKDYNLVGESKVRNKKEQIAELVIGKDKLIVSELGDNSKILYQVGGYIHVRDDSYVVVLKSRIPFLLLLFSLLLGLIGASLLLMKLLANPDVPVVNPYNPMPDPDPYVEDIEDDEIPKANPENGGGSVSMIYTLSANLSLANQSIDMHFKNPSASNHDVVLELYIVSGKEEILIAQSGLVKAGYGLYQMSMIENAAILSEGIYQGKYKVLYYNPNTGERALVQSDITDLTVTVTE